ncbi:MAG TPA: hypothetical protein VFF18_09360, partial [Woeseiaceae bacterium]|nr:hypothetical protein [Woeseiaceae bacterium]
TLSQDLCRLFEETPEIVEADIAKLVKRCEAVRETAESEQDAAPALTANEKDQAIEFGKRPDLFDAILADFETCGLVGEEANKLLCYLARISHRIPAASADSTAIAA